MIERIGWFVIMKVPSGSVLIPPPAPGAEVFGLMDTTSNCAEPGDWACIAGAPRNATPINVTSRASRDIAISCFRRMWLRLSLSSGFLLASYDVGRNPGSRSLDVKAWRLSQEGRRSGER